jgi:hypothetical protein
MEYIKINTLQRASSPNAADALQLTTQSVGDGLHGTLYLYRASTV